MNLRFITLTMASAFAFTGCVDKVDDTGGTTATTTAGTTTAGTTTAGTTTATTAPTGFSITGDFLIGSSDFKELIGLWSLSGTSVDCSGCLYGFDGTFSLVKGAGADFTRGVTVTDVGYEYAGYDIGVVYADSDVWGYAYDNAAAGYTIVSNYAWYYQGYEVPYAYVGYWYR